MTPSLPRRWFDFTLAPDHDGPAAGTGVIVTRGPLNRVVPGTKDAHRGLILIGGPSPHYRWDPDALRRQLEAVLEPGREWIISDSRRTPEPTRVMLRRLAADRATLVTAGETVPDWLPGTLSRAAVAWVTADSMSMIHEALTAGAAVGVLDLPRAREDRVTRAISALVADGLVTGFQEYTAGRPLAPPDPPLAEADRCARLLLARLGGMDRLSC